MRPSLLSRRTFAVGKIVLVAAALLSAVPAVAATLPSGFTETRLANGMSNPTAMALAPDGRIFVAQQGGQLRVIKDGALLPTPFLTVTVNSSGERGLLGIAFDPDFATNQRVYVYYTATTPNVHNRVSRFIANGDVAQPGSEVVLLDLNPLSSATNHNGGAMHFGPDGKLYIAVGENANGANSQTLSNLLGKMLRINADGSIPPDNPFFNQATGNNRAIWALGLRNPFTFSFQPGTGRMFINDVGQNTWEEINDGLAGANYGWPQSEGPTTTPGHTSPLFSYGHGTGNTVGCAITGGSFYNPDVAQFPSSYVGRYFFADFCSGWIRLFNPASGTATGFATAISSPVDLHVADDGSLYYLERGTGSVWQVTFDDSQAPSITSHPSDVTVPVGGTASFSVSASGASPLQYQWQRNGANVPGATATTYTLTGVTSGDDGAAFRAVVSNEFGTVTSNSATLNVTSNSPPFATITAPAHNTLYSGGDTFTYSGTGVDPEEGALPPAAFTWRVDFHHADHVHPYVLPTTGSTSGTFTIATTGHTEANVWYRVHLTVRDTPGLTHSVFVDLLPRVVTLTLATNPAGLQLTLDGQPMSTPLSVQGVVGIQRTLGAPSPQTQGSTNYTFASWSDGGAATHTIATPAVNTTYTATFQVAAGPPGLGLLGTYYDNQNFTGTQVTRLDPTVNFDWGTGSPVAGIGPNTFSVRWRGQVRAKVSGTHTFYTVSDDGVRLWINNQLIIDNFTDHSPTENTGTIALTAGQRYDVRMDYYENGGGAVSRLSWSASSLPREVIPQSQLNPYALLVVGSTTLGPGDEAVRSRLEAQGYVTVVRSGTAAATAHAAGNALVLLSSTVNSPDVNTKYRNVVNPVLSWEGNLFDDMGMTGGTSGTSFGTLGNQTQANIVNAGHPLAGGLSGTVTVTGAASTFTFGVPGSSAAVAARPVGSGTRALVFGYEKGAAMPGLTAPGRRVGFFLENTTAASLNANGLTLMDAAVRWGSGR